MSRRVLPGFGLSISWTLLYLGTLVLVPLVACFLKASSLDWDRSVRRCGPNGRGRLIS